MRQIILIILCLGLAEARVIGAEVVLFAAASLKESLQEISTQYEKESGVKIVLNLGASSLLARQIEEGAPADLFFSADEAKMDALSRKGRIVESTRISRLANSLVLVVSTNKGPPIHTPRDLLSGSIKRIAIAEPRTVPAGIYAREYLETIKLWHPLEKKMVPTENVRAALAAVEVGNADVALVYKTDAAISRKVKTAYEIPQAQSPRIRYPLAVIRKSKNQAPAEKVALYLEGPAATKVFEKHGFIILAK